MKPVHFRKSPGLPLSKAIVFFLLMIVLAACGANPVTSSSPTGGTANKPIKTPTAIPSVSPTVFNLNPTNVTEDAGSLRIQLAAGFQCPNDGADGFGAQNQLVFTSDPTTYSQDGIAQIRSYIESSGMENSGSANPSADTPPTLRWVLGGSVDQFPGAESSENYVPCGAGLILTNTGNTSIQIPQVGVQLEGLPQPNSYTYRLIDACSFAPQGQSCPPVGGANTTCSTYLASIKLGQGEKGAVYSATPMGTDYQGNDCGTLTIAPDAQVHLILIFSLAANIPKNLIYSILPMFTVDTAQGKQTLPLPRLASTLAFASANQFSCYGLQGTTFGLLKSPSAPPNWCV